MFTTKNSSSKNGTVMFPETPFVLQPFKVKTVEKLPMSTVEQRRCWMEKANYNLFNLRSSQITLDFLSDSGTGAMSDIQTARLITGDETYAGAESFYRFKEAVTEFSGFHHILPVHQGRAGEHLLFSWLLKPGQIVPNNTHFDTCQANITLRGGKPIDFPVPSALNPENLDPFKGNMDVEALKTLLKKESENVACVMVTVTNNAFGGQPVSMANVKEVRGLCDRFGLKLVIDSCRIAENAIWIKKRESGYGSRTVASIILEMLAYSDIMTMSAKKDGISHIGGWIGVRDKDIAEELEVLLTITEGFRTYGGLAGRDLDAIAQGLKEVVDENYLEHRVYAASVFGKSLMDVGVPLYLPIGIHALYVDAGKLLPHIPQREFPAQALAVQLYIRSGIRTFGMGSFYHGDNYCGSELVRIALPRRVHCENHFRYVQNAFKELSKRVQEIRGFRITKQGKAVRHFNAHLAYTDDRLIRNEK